MENLVQNESKSYAENRKSLSNDSNSVKNEENTAFLSSMVNEILTESN